MELTLTTPALLFPAISLLLLAYTNRFLHLAQLSRNLYSQYRNSPDKMVLMQLQNLRKRKIYVTRLTKLPDLRRTQG